jgi:deoxyribodipyrimidine photo-lyase
MMRSLYWLRHDLRIHDNETLYQLTQQSSHCAFVFSTFQTLKTASPYRKNFYYESLGDLRAQLQRLGHEIIMTDQPISTFLGDCLSTHQIEALFYTREYAFDEVQEEKSIDHFCHKNDIKVKSFDQGTLVRETDLPFTLLQMPFVFTDFRKKLEANLTPLNLIPRPFKWPHPLVFDFPGLPISVPIAHEKFTGGETAGLQRLHHYLWITQAIKNYKETRNNLINFDDSTKLSPWLNAGCISPRLVMKEVKKFEQEVCANDSTYWVFFELLWRDYFKFFSRKFANKIFLSEGITSGSSPNTHDHVAFKLWSEGKTREPFVNANMIELNTTGWMSNRGRQNVASYLIHDLGVNWTWGARYFEERLIDYDPDLNWGNWLYLSGRGPDPRSRKFNIAKQAATYDPFGDYQRSMLK